MARRAWIRTGELQQDGERSQMRLDETKQERVMTGFFDRTVSGVGQRVHHFTLWNAEDVAGNAKVDVPVQVDATEDGPNMQSPPPQVSE